MENESGNGRMSGSDESKLNRRNMTVLIPVKTGRSSLIGGLSRKLDGRALHFVEPTARGVTFPVRTSCR